MLIMKGLTDSPNWLPLVSITFPYIEGLMAIYLEHQQIWASLSSRDWWGKTHGF